MKKWLSSLLCLLLAIAMVLTLAACGEDSKKKSKDDDDEKEGTSENGETDKEGDEEGDEKEPAQKADPAELIIGSWKTTLDLSEALSDQIGMDITGVKLPLTLSFTADEVAFSCDTDAFLDSLIDAGLEVACAQNNMTLDEFEAQLAEQGMTMDDAKEMLREQFSAATATITNAFAQARGEYEVDGNTLLIDDEEMEITVTESKLTIRYSGSQLEGNPMNEAFNTTYTKA